MDFFSNSFRNPSENSSRKLLLGNKDWHKSLHPLYSDKTVVQVATCVSVSIWLCRLVKLQNLGEERDHNSHFNFYPALDMSSVECPNTHASGPTLVTQCSSNCLIFTLDIAAVTKYVTWLCDLNNRNLFLIVLKAGKSKIKVMAHLVLGEGSLPGLKTTAFLLWPHMVFPWCMHMKRERYLSLL